ncbi:MAG: winged helix-turn-helix domain-containing protein, partial [Flavobacteriales bacterium]|nr:winged helix-turn-helix domain-containing protein [Flavobacteriales bacterium]
SSEQERLVRKRICEKRPEQLKLDFALWSRGAVLELIEREFGLRLGLRTVGDYLARWNFTPQKPIKRAYERNDRAIRQWKEQEYPAIARQARAEKAEIHWLDGTAIVNTDVRGRSYAAPSPKRYGASETGKAARQWCTHRAHGPSSP